MLVIPHYFLFKLFAQGWGVSGAGTYVAPSFNHAGCVISTSGAFSFLFHAGSFCTTCIILLPSFLCIAV